MVMEISAEVFSDALHREVGTPPFRRRKSINEKPPAWTGLVVDVVGALVAFAVSTGPHLGSLMSAICSYSRRNHADHDDSDQDDQSDDRNSYYSSLLRNSW